MIKKETIKKIINEVGFDLSGVIRPGLVDGFDGYIDWIGKNYHADLKWMENNLDKRQDTSKILEGCRSIIVMGVSYFNGNYQPEDIKNKKKALIARYAWGDDYHEVLKKKLKILIEKIGLMIKFG